MSYLTDRRRFLKTTALTGVGVFVSGTAAAEDSKSPNERIRFACIGVGGKGASDSADAKRARRRRGHLRHRRQHAREGRRKSFPEAAKYNDFRKMLDEDGQEHRRGHGQHARSHARPGLGHGHADGQGLLHAKAADAHDLRSPQAGRDRPRDERGHADGQPGHGQQRAAQDGRRGSRRAWWATSRKFTCGRIGRSGRRADRVRPKRRCRRTCTGICGSAPRRSAPTLPAIIRSPGAAGGISAPAPWATWPATRSTCRSWPSTCAIRRPCKPTTSGHNRDSYPKWSIINYDFPANANRPALKMIWYDGGKKPSADLFDGEQVSETGVLLIGDKGKLFAPGDYCEKGYKLLGGADRPEGRVRSSRPATSPNSPARSRAARRPARTFADYCRPADRNDSAGQPGRVGRARRRLAGQEDRVGRQEPQADQRPGSRSDRHARLSRGLQAVGVAR